MVRVVFLAAFVVASAATCAAESFPYTAYVVLDSSSVRSGPGDSFYPTCRLRRSAQVEVYRHDASRWAAIRPPGDSFSLVPASAVEVTEDAAGTIGIVTADGLKTRIGSRVNDKHEGVEYITLKPGETVEIQETVTRNGKKWFRIAPPAGEFRWIRLSDLSETNPDLLEESPIELTPTGREMVGATVDDTDQAPLQLAQFENEVDDPSASVSLPTEDYAVDSNAPFTSLPPNSNAYMDGGIIPGQPEFSEAPIYPAFQTALPSNGGGIPSLRTTMINPGPVAKHLLENELADIELQLSLTVSQPTAAWELPPLRIRAQALIDTSDEPSVRQRANGILSKIAQFTDIRRRQTSVNAEASQFASVMAPSVMATTYGNGQYYTGPTTLPGERIVMGDAGPYGGFSDYGSNYAGAGGEIISDRLQSEAGQYGNSVASSSVYNYDGTGWLMPVVTERNDMPKYVLTDSSGEIIQFVSPSPGMNLQPYVSKQVGIIGKKDRLKEMDQPHIVADRVISLDKVKR